MASNNKPIFKRRINNHRYRPRGFSFAIDLQRIKAEKVAQYDFPDATILHYEVSQALSILWWCNCLSTSGGIHTLKPSICD
jgi:hypothetical protein